MTAPIAAKSPALTNLNQGFTASFSQHRLEVNGKVVSQGQSSSFNPWSAGDQFQAGRAGAGQGAAGLQQIAGQNPAAAQANASNPLSALQPDKLAQGALQVIGQLTQVLQSLVQMLGGLLSGQGKGQLPGGPVAPQGAQAQTNQVPAALPQAQNR